MDHRQASPENAGILAENREIQGQRAEMPADTRFRPGRSGNPAGRPAGARNRATILREAALAERAVGVAERLLDKAEAGDVTAARLVMTRLLPARLGPGIDLPDATNIDDLMAAIAALATATAAGQIAAADANAITRTLQLQLRALEAWTAAGELAAKQEQLRLEARERRHREARADLASLRTAPPVVPPVALPAAVPVAAAPPATAGQGTAIAAGRPPACGRMLPLAEWLRATGLEQSLPAALAKARGASGEAACGTLSMDKALGGGTT